jgi:hypothetical protein
MLKFRNKLWSDADYVPTGPQCLQVAVLLWLRTYDRDGPTWLGLENMLEFCVPFSTEMKLGLNIPELPADYIIASDGTVTYVPGVPNSVRFVYVSRNFARELDLDLYGSLHISYSVHIKWIEWALANAILMLYKAGKPWRREQHGQFKVTVGGMEVADFL